MKISATIVTLNEEKNISRAIRSLACADEILVVDSGSTDRTLQIAERLGARVLTEHWRGYAQQKNYAASLSAHDWILSIDADESLSDRLQREILALKNRQEQVAGYSFPRLAFYMGRWIRHSGWYPDRKVRLYDRRRGGWVGEYVHESVRINGATGELQGDLLHFTCASLEEHLGTLDRYTSLAAQELIAHQKRVPLWRLVLDPAWTFFRTYILQRGFLDGPQGITLAWMAALYTFLKYARARPDLTGGSGNENSPS